MVSIPLYRQRTFEVVVRKPTEVEGTESPGSPEGPDGQPTWKSDNVKVFTVVGTPGRSRAVVKAVADGEATITATWLGNTGSVRVTTEPGDKGASKEKAGPTLTDDQAATLEKTGGLEIVIGSLE